MATAIKMPQLGITMTEAKVVSWLKHEGEPVKKGDPVASIETDKINADVEATGDGVLRRIVAPEGSTVPVVGLLAVIGAADEPESAIDAVVSGGGAPSGRRSRTAPPAPAPAAAAAPTSPPAAPRAPVAVAPAAPAPAQAGVAVAGEVRASPMARRVAADLGVELGTVRGSGPGGRIVEADVRAAAAAAPAAAPGENGFVRASPLARRLAREHGLELEAVAGTGPDGRVVERDILAALEAQTADAAAGEAPIASPAAPAADGGALRRRETIVLDGMRRVIADRMWESLQRTAQLTLTVEADATALVALRSHLIPAARVFGHRPPTYTDLLVFIVARTLKEHPLLNSSLVGEGASREIAVWDAVNMGVAVSLDRGLLVPVIAGADRKPLQAISQELADLAERARAGRLGMAELEGGTFTLTNLGQVEVETFTPIINPPQAAILGVGRIMKKPAVVDDAIVVRQQVSLSLTFDHRVVDGMPAGAFLRDVKRAIEAASLEG
jgi:pyruvate dehydrogenase E2 component (dihydrolipoamide acetyltransferase)